MPMIPPELGICAFEGRVAVGFGFFNAGDRIDRVSKSNGASLEVLKVEAGLAFVGFWGIVQSWGTHPLRWAFLLWLC